MVMFGGFLFTYFFISGTTTPGEDSRSVGFEGVLWCVGV